MGRGLDVICWRVERESLLFQRIETGLWGVLGVLGVLGALSQRKGHC